MIKGMDISTLLEEEQCGAKYYDNGVSKDLFEILKDRGINSVRLRLWNNPFDEKGNPYGAGTNDFEKVILLARRAKEARMSWLLDFHYSDFWADPGKQIVPKEWQGLTAHDLAKAVYEYTKKILTVLKKMKLEPFMVQVGNEITNGLLWPHGNRSYDKRTKEYNYDSLYFNPDLTMILNAGITAVREILPDAKVMIHLDNGGNHQLYLDWFDGFIRTGGKDFDVIGLSYYPFWHGTMSMLKENMDDIAVRYQKDLYVDEVSMGYTMEDYSSYEGLNPEDRKGYATKQELVDKLEYPMTKEGQLRFMQDVIKVIENVPENRGRGFYYWEPAWIPVKGCGWATEAALKYTGEEGPGGNEWANQALFDYDGNVLPALDYLKTLWDGGESSFSASHNTKECIGTLQY